MLFLRFEGSEVSLQRLNGALTTYRGPMPSDSEVYLHLADKGDRFHYYTHTDSAFLTRLKGHLQQQGISFVDVQEDELPDYARDILQLHRQGREYLEEG